MTEQEYELALVQASALMSATSPKDLAELERLADLIEVYEDEHYPIGPPTPEAAREFREDQERNESLL